MALCVGAVALAVNYGVALENNAESTLHTKPGGETRLRNYKVGRPGREEGKVINGSAKLKPFSY
jgi:hypothetical protein